MKIERLMRATRKARATQTLPRRADRDLPWFEETSEAIILDACVYIDQLQGRLPADIEARIVSRSVYHSSLAMAELSFALGRLDPADARTEGAVAAITALMSAIPAQRVLTPGMEQMIQGAVLAGVMARLLGYAEGGRRKALIDAMLASQAAREGLLLVTRNIADFDRLSQLLPRLRIALYRSPEGSQPSQGR